MTPPRLFGNLADGDDADRAGAPPLTELSLSFVPLAVVSEWTRCSQTADFVARYFAYDYGDAERAGNVLSTIVNELVENAVKFSGDKTVAARLVVREYAERVVITTSNSATEAQAAAFEEMITGLVRGDPEAMFAKQIATPPEFGSAGIGLIILRKDYSASIGARVTSVEHDGTAIVDVEVTIQNTEVEAT